MCAARLWDYAIILCDPFHVQCAQRLVGISRVFGVILRWLGARKDLSPPAAIASSSERAPLFCIALSTNEPRLTSKLGRRVTRQVKV